MRKIQKRKLWDISKVAQADYMDRDDIKTFKTLENLGFKGKVDVDSMTFESTYKGISITFNFGAGNTYFDFPKFYIKYIKEEHFEMIADLVDTIVNHFGGEVPRK